MSDKLIYKNESYFVIGLCMDVHSELGKGFNESVYGDVLEIELVSNGVPYKKEAKYSIDYKGRILKHHYYADFVIDNKIILELKYFKRAYKTNTELLSCFKSKTWFNYEFRRR